jgi:RNA polymerase primary sigma factor
MALVVNFKNSGSKYFNRTNTMVDYFNDIKKFETDLTYEDELALFGLYKNGTSKEKAKARKILIEANQRFVVSVARAYAKNNNLMDLIDEGNIGLMEAIDAFDPNVKVEGKTVKFMTFAVHYIRRAINQYNVNNDSIVKKANISKTYHIIAQARNKFLQENGRQPTPEELKEVANKCYGVKIKDTTDMLDVKVTYIDEGTVGDDEDDTNLAAISVYNTYSANGNAYEKAAKDEYNKEMVSSLLKVLTPREQTVIKLAFGIGQSRELTNAEIGDKIGLTTERVRQMRASIMGRLKSEFKKKINESL